MAAQCHVVSHLHMPALALPSVQSASPTPFLSGKLPFNPQDLAQGLAPEAVRSSHSQGTVTTGVPLFPHGLVSGAERLVPSVSQARVWHTVGAQYISAE